MAKKQRKQENDSFEIILEYLLQEVEETKNRAQKNDLMAKAALLTLISENNAVLADIRNEIRAMRSV